MLRLILPRLLLMALPFVVYFLWRGYWIRRGREFGRAPWGWLIAAGSVMVVLSFAATAFLQDMHVDKTYIPAQTQPDGSVKPGRYVPKDP